MACQTLRIDQIDANILDDEIENIAQTSIDDVISSLPVHAARYFEMVRPEIRLTMNALLWSHRVYKGCSPGQEIMDIAYKNYTQKKIFAHFCCSVFLPYMARRLPEMTSSVQWSKLVTKFEAVLEAISILHSLYFVRFGGHSTFVEQLLGLRNWNNNLPSIGTINYDTQNRELMWHAFRDVVLLGMPLARVVREKTVQNRRLARRLAEDDVGDAHECGICDKPAVIPMVGTKCRHICCYTCTATRDFSCPVCSEKTKMVLLRGRIV